MSRPEFSVLSSDVLMTLLVRPCDLRTRLIKENGEFREPGRDPGENSKSFPGTIPGEGRDILEDKPLLTRVMPKPSGARRSLSRPPFKIEFYDFIKGESP